MGYKEDKKAKKDEIMATIEALKPKKELKDAIDLLLIEWQELMNQYENLTSNDCVNRYRDAEATVGEFTERFMLFMIDSEILKEEWTEKDILHIMKAFKELEGLG